MDKKQLTIKEMLWTPEQREEFTKTKEYRDAINLWNPRVGQAFNAIGRVGKLMSSIKELPEDAVLPQWEEHYVTYVKTWEQIQAQMSDFKRMSGKTNSAWVANYWWCQVIDSTFKGWKDECFMNNAIRAILPEGQTLRFATDIEDREMGVDAVILGENGEVIAGLQYKPRSYFVSTRESTKKARLEYNPKKYQKFTDEYDAAVFYVEIDSVKQGNRPKPIKAPLRK